jgi:hypothetical protein
MKKTTDTGIRYNNSANFLPSRTVHTTLPSATQPHSLLLPITFSHLYRTSLAFSSLHRIIGTNFSHAAPFFVYFYLPSDTVFFVKVCTGKRMYR